MKVFLATIATSPALSL